MVAGRFYPGARKITGATITRKRMKAIPIVPPASRVVFPMLISLVSRAIILSTGIVTLSPLIWFASIDVNRN